MLAAIAWVCAEHMLPLAATPAAQVGETVMALQRAVLQPGGRELMVYGTINGAIGGRGGGAEGHLQLRWHRQDCCLSLAWTRPGTDDLACLTPPSNASM